MSNLVFIEGSIAETAELLAEYIGDSDRLHFTNGVYSAPTHVLLPTTLAAFQYLSEEVANEDDIFIIAVNSDRSMQIIMDKKNASPEERAALEGQVVRAKKVAEPLAALDSKRPVFVVFYDEETPTALYNQLAELEFNLASLHKWGFGTNPNAPRIEGAHNFANVYGFPLPNDAKPFCHDITVGEDQSSFVQVVDLKSYVEQFKAPVEPVRSQAEIEIPSSKLVFIPLNVPSAP